MIYLDNAATTKVCKQAAEKALEVMTEIYGNPSSTHSHGRKAKEVLETARKLTSAALGGGLGEIAFTSGGTESNNWAIRGAAYENRRVGKHIISSLTEHDSVLKTLKHMESMGYEITLLSPEKDGSIAAEAVFNALRGDTALISLMLVNNETGAITDIAKIGRGLEESGSKAILHTDAVQAFIKTPINAKTLKAHLISISGHKIHAPKGVGALWIGPGLKLSPLIFGGGQEKERRPGTEGLPQIAALGEAVRIAQLTMEEDAARMKALRAKAIECLMQDIPDLVVIGGGSPHILSISRPGYGAEVLMNYLDFKGISVSRSSACKKGRRSHVLTAMNLKNPVIDGALRISLSRYTTDEDIVTFCKCLKQAYISILPAL